MSLINVSNLTFCYEGSYDNIFEDVSFQIDTDWKLGFIGRNGKGKTTFLKLLLGQYEHLGSISGCIQFKYFPFEVADETLSAIDVVESIYPQYEYWMLCRELNLLEFDQQALYRPFDTLSNGEQTKLLLAALFLMEDCFLLIDEPTNHLDIRGRQLVSKYLSQKKSYILVCHDRAFLDGCIDHVLSINNTDIEVQKGNFSSWWKNKQETDALEREQNERLKKDIKRMGAAARRTTDWSNKIEKTKKGSRNSGLRPDTGYIGHQAAKMMQRAKNIEAQKNKAIEEKSQLLKNIEEDESIKFNALIPHSKKLIEASNLSIAYSHTPVFENLDFRLDAGQRVVLKGKNGAGKSSLIKLILGQAIPHLGTLNLLSGLKISYVPQDASGLCGTLTDFADACDIDKSLFLAILRKLGFARTQFEKDMRNYSSGQKKKVLLARSLCERAHIYIWDEPLNYIDIISRITIEQTIVKYCPTMILVEHDQAFIDRIATSVITL